MMLSDDVGTVLAEDVEGPSKSDAVTECRKRQQGLEHLKTMVPTRSSAPFNESTPWTRNSTS
eukprot:5197306-Amphidinium_carterae.2